MGRRCAARRFGSPRDGYRSPRARGPRRRVALLAGLALALGARIAARLLRPLIRAAIDPENLRAA